MVLGLHESTLHLAVIDKALKDALTQDEAARVANVKLNVFRQPVFVHVAMDLVEEFL